MSNTSLGCPSDSTTRSRHQRHSPTMDRRPIRPWCHRSPQRTHFCLTGVTAPTEEWRSIMWRSTQRRDTVSSAHDVAVSSGSGAGDAVGGAPRWSASHQARLRQMDGAGRRRQRLHPVAASYRSPGVGYVTFSRFAASNLQKRCIWEGGDPAGRLSPVHLLFRVGTGRATRSRLSRRLR